LDYVVLHLWYLYSTFSGVLELEVDFFEDLKTALLVQCKERLQKIVLDEDYILAAILDPRQKLQVFTGKLETVGK